MYTDKQINIIINTIKKGQGEKDAKNALKELSSGFEALTGFSLASTGALTIAVKAGEKFIEWAKEAEKESNNYNIIAAKQNAILKATGDQSGLTGTQLMDMADRLSRLNGIEDDNIINAQSLMLTYQNIGDTIFPKAMQASIDMSTTFGGLENSTKALGMALNDPVGSLTKLQKAGIKFTDDQKTLIQGFVDTNQLAKAQEVILDAVNAKVGGTGAAMNAASDGTEDLKIAQQELNEVLGEQFVPIAKAWNEFWASQDRHIVDNIKSTNLDQLALEAWTNSYQYSAAVANATSQDELYAIADGTSSTAKIFIENYQKMLDYTDRWATDFSSSGNKISMTTDQINKSLLDEDYALAAVKAGISGVLQKAEETYLSTTKNLTTENDKLTLSLKWQQNVYATAPSKITELTQKLADYEQQMQDTGNTNGALATKINETKDALQKEKDALEAGPGAITSLNNALDENKAKQEAAEKALEATTAQIIYQNAASSLDAEGQLELARHMGILSESDYELAEKTLKIKQALDEKNIVMADAVKMLEALYDANLPLQSLPDKTIQYQVVTSYSGVPYIGQSIPDTTTTKAGSGSYEYTDNSGQKWLATKDPDGSYSYTKRAAGGPVYSGIGYMVGESGPEPFFPGMDGTVLSQDKVVRLQDIQNVANSVEGGTVIHNETIQISVSGAGDADKVADKIIQKLHLQLGVK
jgi:hypothetical protein